MRIALITPGFPPDLGGVETHVGRLAAGLAARGHDISVLSHHRRGTRTPSPDDNLHVQRFRTFGSARYPVSPALWRQARQTAADVVHAHSYHALAAVAALFVDTTVPVVVTPHYHGAGHTPLARALHPIYRPVGRRVLERAAAIVAVSKAEQTLIGRDFPSLADRVVVIRHGVSVDTVAGAFDSEPPTVLVLGRLESYKRVDAVIHAFASTGMPGQLVVLGGGPDRIRLQEHADATSRGGDIRFLGTVSDDELARWLYTAIAVVSMSEREAFGLVALEGFAAGAKVLLSPIPAHLELVDELPGDAVRTVSPDGLTAALRQAMAGPRDQPRAARSWDDVAAEHADLYLELLAKQ